MNTPGAFGDYSYPIKLYEAMACGRPVVAARTASTAWVLRDFPGRLVAQLEAAMRGIGGVIIALVGARLRRAIIAQRSCAPRCVAPDGACMRRATDALQHGCRCMAGVETRNELS
ncbi:hypothetical protein PG2T_04240 [Immundisolibacter cernigliae]|uniref:Uncharacterized protein n=1 Tax=Immundisolibacter cernigliae TaxID=1810504 RepID=A0A1B1YS21_9GAMM|nr:hypothetical protein PG2T_04240 [Immundisolibacter cernigliae]